MLQMSNIFIHLIEVQIEIGFNGIHSNVEVGFHQAHVIKHVSNPRRFTIKGLSALLRGAFTSSSFLYRLSLNFLFLLLFFSLTLVIFNLLEKSFHIFMFTKIMLPNSFLVQRGKLLWISYKGFIKKHGFERWKRMKMNSIELSYFSDNTTNTNSTNNIITYEP